MLLKSTMVSLGCEQHLGQRMGCEVWSVVRHLHRWQALWQSIGEPAGSSEGSSTQLSCFL